MHPSVELHTQQMVMFGLVATSMLALSIGLRWKCPPLLEVNDRKIRNLSMYHLFLQKLIPSLAVFQNQNVTSFCVEKQTGMALDQT